MTVPPSRRPHTHSISHAHFAAGPWGAGYLVFRTGPPPCFRTGQAHSTVFHSRYPGRLDCRVWRNPPCTAVKHDRSLPERSSWRSVRRTSSSVVPDACAATHAWTTLSMLCAWIVGVGCDSGCVQRHRHDHRTVCVHAPAAVRARGALSTEKLLINRVITPTTARVATSLTHNTNEITVVLNSR